MTAPLKILYASAEVVPFAKTGGLADVAGALPKVLAAMGHDARIVMPLYRCIDRDKFGLRPVTDTFRIPHGHESIEIQIEQSDAIPGVPTYFIRNDYLFDRPGLYGQADDDHRFVAYSRAILEMLPHLGWTPDVINCNDWHTGLVPVYTKTVYADHPVVRDIGTVYTIHNLAYQGVFHKGVMELAGLPWELFTWDRLEYFDQFNFMKAGLQYADKLSTVSPTYAKEIQGEDYGEGLQGVLTYRKADLSGILNGIDYDVWNPRADGFLPAHFTADDLTGKTACKAALQEEMGLTVDARVPIFGLVTRLSSQKGLDLLDGILPGLLAKESMQVVILGTGDQYIHDWLTRLAAAHPDKLALALKFDNALAHRIYAGCDAFLMPSHYEPCGLGQMISLAYGTVPVVRATGGLADSVKEFRRPNNGKPQNGGNGFVFEPYTTRALKMAIGRTLDCFADPACWREIVANAFRSDFTWEHSARQYVKVYEGAIAHARTRPVSV
jgi:starch synthase